MRHFSFAIFILILFNCAVGFTTQTQTQPDKTGLDDLIRSLQPQTTSTETETQPQSASETRIDEERIKTFSGISVPKGFDTWQLTDRQCHQLLRDAKIKTHAPEFATPFVKTPLLLDSPVEGVEIDSRWPTENHRRVMDCRLIVALVQLARYAREAGVIKIEYYSSWRPVTISDNCKKGLKGRKCRKIYERARDGHLPSQHARATAIDIRWFTFENGQVVDVLEHYEKHFHEPPCDDSPDTWQGKFLQKLACLLHRDKIFNVMLTPNANKDHENHFHFDITPNAEWYILR